jgi:hypothetical protein
MPADELGKGVLGICRGIALEQFAIGCHIQMIEPARPESAQKFARESESFSVAKRLRILARDKVPGTVMEWNSVLKGRWKWPVTMH